MLYYSTNPNAAASMLAAICGPEQQNLHCRDYRLYRRKLRDEVAFDAAQQLMNEWISK